MRPSLYTDERGRWAVAHDDTLDVLPKLPTASVEAIITDPPYGIGFVEAKWDKPGTRAAFTDWSRAWAEECRRLLKPGGYLIAFGAPRTFHRLVAGVEDAGFEIRDVIMWLHGQGVPKSRRLPGGFGTALKPAYEPILVARAPLAGTLTETHARYGTGLHRITSSSGAGGRWPTNLTLSHASSCRDGRCAAGCPVGMIDHARPEIRPSRFFYTAKASRAEREAGCDELPAAPREIFSNSTGVPTRVRNSHPTVRPLAVMRWLITLVCPENGIVLDPFTGSGTTGAAALLEGRPFVGIEREAQFVQIACARLVHWGSGDLG